MMPGMTLQSLRRIATCLLGRCVLAWFALSIGVASASPLTQPKSFELICTSTGAVKMIVKGDDGSVSVGAGHLDCPMCLPLAAPPPPVMQKYADICSQGKGREWFRGKRQAGRARAMALQ